MPIVPENNALFYLYIMYICNEYLLLLFFITNKMSKIFIFAHFGLNIHYSFYIL